MPKAPRVPSYRLHKSTGQAVVTLNGHDFYLGAHDSPESHQEYERRVAEWLAGGRRVQPKAGATPTLAEIVAAYIAFAKGYYVKDGKPTSQLERVTRSLEVATGLYAGTVAAEFGPLKLKAVRHKMIDRDWSRIHINHCIGCIKRAFQWAASEELVPVTTYQALCTVAGLERGRSEAREGSEVRPAPEEAIEAVKAVVTPQIAALIDLQLWTAARPGEAVAIRPGCVDRSGKVDLGFGPIDLGMGVWVYRPPTHKTAHHGHQRILLLGPKAQTVLAPFLMRHPDAACFSPAEAEAWRLARMRERRVSKVQPSQTDRSKRWPRKRPGEFYTVSSYGKAISYGVEKAECASWHAHQLRHNAATRLVAQFGWEIARIVLGHRSVEMTRRYAEDDLRKAAEAIRKAG